MLANANGNSEDAVETMVDVAQLISAFAAIGAVVAAAVQIRGLRQDARATRASEIESVAVATKVLLRPIAPDAGDGMSRWKYRFTVHNPGRFPISQVKVRVDFPVHVRREHFDGSRDDPAQYLETGVPVVTAYGHSSWDRTVLLEHAHRHRLPETRATVSFDTPDGGRMVNTWPHEVRAERLDTRLGRLLRARR